MRSFFPLVAAAILLFAGPAFAQLSVFGMPYARACFMEATADGSDIDPCDRSLQGELLGQRDRAATYVNRAVVKTNAGRLAAALRDLTHAESLRPDLGEIYASRGNILFYQSSFEEALAETDRGIERGMKKLHAAYYNRGLTLEQLGRIEEAKDAYRQSIALAPEFHLAKARLSMF
jgi:tetratricopeptide (TPR) repeat protein